jgi:vitamin B12 transporter
MNSRSAAVVFGFCCSMLFLNTALADDSNVKLKEVVVTATKTDKDPQDVTQSVTVITADEIKKSGALTAAEVIERTVGVDLHEYGPKGSLANFSLRGSTAAQVLVLLDGRRMNSTQNGEFNMSNLPIALENIERIEIVRGPSSALYGADALGGVINIITKKPAVLDMTFTATAGTHDYQSLTGSTSNKVNKAYYRLSAANEKSDGFRENSRLQQTTMGGKLGYEFSKNSSLEFAADYIAKDTGIPGSILSPTPLAHQWDRNLNLDLSYKVKFSKELDLRASVYNKRNKLLYENPSYFEDSRHLTTSTGTELQANWLVTSWNLLTAGTEIKADHIDSSDNGGHSTSLTAVYLQDEISIGEPFILVLGGRYDKHSVYGEEWSPRVSARYLVSKTGTIIRASWGEAFRAPTFNDLYWPTTSWAKGNPDLKPEKSMEYEGGIEQSLGKGRSIKFTVFERQSKDLIVWMPDAGVWTPTNFGSARVWGYEAEAKVTFFNTLVWAVNYTYMDTANQEAGDHIIGAPAEQVKSYINYTVPKVKTNIYLEGRYVRNYWIETVGASNGGCKDFAARYACVLREDGILFGSQEHVQSSLSNFRRISHASC